MPGLKPQNTSIASTMYFSAPAVYLSMFRDCMDIFSSRVFFCPSPLLPFPLSPRIPPFCFLHFAAIIQGGQVVKKDISCFQLNLHQGDQFQKSYSLTVLAQNVHVKPLIVPKFPPGNPVMALSATTATAHVIVMVFLLFFFFFFFFFFFHQARNHIKVTFDSIWGGR
jgi:hypothetical protein